MTKSSPFWGAFFDFLLIFLNFRLKIIDKNADV
jgi:hypothetical protein